MTEVEKLRAEVERLRDLLTCIERDAMLRADIREAAREQSSGYRCRASITAYQRGAEAMREAAALCAEREETQLPLHVASAIRALPVPEDK